LDLEPFGSHGEKSWNVFIKNLNFFLTEERMTFFEDMGVSKLSAKVFIKKVL